MDTRFLEEERDVFVKQRAFLDDFVLPDYDAFNVRNIKSMVGKIYGVNSLGKGTFPDEFLADASGVEKVFLIVMDGFGYNRLLTHVKRYDDTLSELIGKGGFDEGTKFLRYCYLLGFKLAQDLCDCFWFRLHHKQKVTIASSYPFPTVTSLFAA